MRLIDADALKHAVSNIDMHGRSEQFYEIMGEIAEVLSSAPTIDAVPVVRCRECENATMTVNGELKYCKFWQPDGGDALYLPGDFFCGEGKRMDAEKEEPT